MEINNHKRKCLIIDLRNNKGSNDNFSNYLASFVAKKPFKWNASFTIKPSEQLKKFTVLNNDKTQAYFKEILECKMV